MSSLELLRLAVEALDEYQRADDEIRAARTTTYIDRYGAPKELPQLTTRRLAANRFSALYSKLGLDLPAEAGKV